MCGLILNRTVFTSRQDGRGRGENGWPEISFLFIAKQASGRMGKRINLA
ncbi:hypothetical protein CAMRE0001_2805 [Campylobacter rectus RM3267]|uniref:Uncharacterized protein n=1 Tax=Campylobacter rectus RM3267 TaxID=553218 RepID=B9D0Z8_CAMRE|nr:hypothetical protein CAMRE0001_2805 [Campylobacter rectus RM3267]